MRKIALSGGTGFVGGGVLSRLIQEKIPATVFVRNLDALRIESRDVDVACINHRTNWGEALRHCSVFIHCAGLAHLPNHSKKHALKNFRHVNKDLTLKLARSAADAGVQRFVFVSSIAVNGLASGREPFSPEDAANPQTPYAVSKYEAEQGLFEISRETGLEIAVVRPPLVYGAHAPGNFGTLVNLLLRGWPIPLGAVKRNRRSYVALPNLIDLLLMICHHPAAANQVFLVSDGEDLSTADLVRRLAEAMGRPACLWPVPPALLRAVAKLLGRSDLANRLVSDLRVNISKTRQILGWSPRVSVEKGLRLAVRGVSE